MVTPLLKRPTDASPVDHRAGLTQSRALIVPAFHSTMKGSDS